MGAVVRPGDLDRPARDWRLGSLLQHGHLVAVLELSDPADGQGWLKACARLFDRPWFVDATGEAETDWGLDGTTLVLRLGAPWSAISVEALDQALDSRIALPDAEGTILADAWIAPFDGFHLHERPPEGVALSRLFRAIVGPQAWFFLGSGRSRVTIAADGTLSVDDARPILPIESGDFLGRSPVSRDAIALAHPQAFLALAASLDREALAAAIAGIVGEEATSSFVAHLGDALAISMPPVRGVAQIPPVFLAARHSDREAVLDATARACDQAVASMASIAAVERKEYRGAVLFTLCPERGSFPADARFLEGLFRPTIAVMDDRVGGHEEGDPPTAEGRGHARRTERGRRPEGSIDGGLRRLGADRRPPRLVDPRPDALPVRLTGRSGQASRSSRSAVGGPRAASLPFRSPVEHRLGRRPDRALGGLHRLPRVGLARVRGGDRGTRRERQRWTEVRRRPAGSRPGRHRSNRAGSRLLHLRERQASGLAEERDRRRRSTPRSLGPPVRLSR